MKRIKILLTAFAVVITVGSALAVKANFFGSGSVYCANTCTGVSRVNFRNNPAGSSVNPCGVTGTGAEKPSWIFDTADVCVQNNIGLKYDAVSAGN